MSTETQNNQPTENKNEVIETNLAKQRQMYERKLEQERLEKQQLAERIAAIEAVNKERQHRSNTNDSDDTEDSEPYVDHRKLHREFDKFQRRLEETFDKKAEAKAAAMIEQERMNNYVKQNSDFNQIMENGELIQKFADKYPALAENILRMPQNFDRQKLVYENIKALGVDKPEQKQPSVQEKIDANRRSPYYQPSGVGTAPYAQQGDYSPSGQKNAYQKMKELQSKLRMG